MGKQALRMVIFVLAVTLSFDAAQAQTKDSNGQNQNRNRGAEFKLFALGARTSAYRARFRLLPPVRRYANPGSKALGLSPAPMEGAQSVKGSGTPGQLPMWLDSRTIGDSVITELNGNIGIGTITPGSKLSVAGGIIAINELGSGVFARGGDSTSSNGGNGVSAIGGDTTGDLPGGTGVFARGGTGENGGGEGVSAIGGDSNSGRGGEGVSAIGGDSDISSGGSALVGIGGGSTSGDGGNGVAVIGGRGTGPGHRGGDGITALPGDGTAGATDGRAGLFQGDVAVTGTLTKGGGSFKMDHPLDPENKYLSHSFVESPDMMNVYNGNVTLDHNGEAVVKLPGYFEALNKDFRYQLTAIGAPGPFLYIAGKIADNRFRVAGGQPGMEVSWQVTGIRKDPWAERHRIAVEQEKSERERGHYLYPELYGQSEERGVEWARNPSLMQRMRSMREQVKQKM